ncbi:MAG: hypothetical protein H0X25_13300 [Acidobacteriales bacterium]|nr:hypothetical protein [Terriglobales bacterium]
MSGDTRNVLDVLKFELNFLEQGGYGRSVHSPWKPTSVFQDSPSCINFNSSEERHPCGECLLSQWVPANSQNDPVPCHHIPLNAEGETIDSLERQASQVELEDKLKDWLRQAIARLERQRSASARMP